MTREQVKLVQRTWEKVRPNSTGAAALFYNRLFELDPSLKELFKIDMEEQGRRLMDMIHVAVRSLDRLDQVVPAIEALGKRHVHYGVKVEHYATVGQALLWTLERGLGAEFTPVVRSAWTDVYTLLANAMIAAGAAAPKQEAAI